MIIIDYGLGNLASIHNMLKQIGSKPVVSDDYNIISNSKDLILPGVGNFEKGIQNLKAKSLDKAIIKACKNNARLLGICLGMHLLFYKSEEGKSNGLGLVEGEVKKFRFTNNELKVPHMGWNNVNTSNNNLFKEIENMTRFYFCHSYHFSSEDRNLNINTTNYKSDICAAFNFQNIYGVQFHPEKSYVDGLKLINNFCEIC